ncbi:MAG: division/cell wall cluster transcriptional repressor MraZ [Eubacterium sp.]|nr:division/cell wall cluster transcriptional repressor MraZ [Eubacterium sp.]
MFMGEFNHTIDDKGRLIVPVKFREQLGKEFVVTKGMDGCLFVYPKKAWEEFEEKLAALPITVDKDARKFVRFFLSGAAAVELDKQGRILLPSTLRAHAGLKKDVVFTGVLDRVEIWSAENWNSYGDYEDMDEVASRMREYGFNL